MGDRNVFANRSKSFEQRFAPPRLITSNSFLSQGSTQGDEISTPLSGDVSTPHTFSLGWGKEASKTPPKSPVHERALGRQQLLEMDDIEECDSDIDLNSHDSFHDEPASQFPCEPNGGAMDALDDSADDGLPGLGGGTPARSAAAASSAIAGVAMDEGDRSESPGWISGEKFQFDAEAGDHLAAPHKQRRSRSDVPPTPATIRTRRRKPEAPNSAPPAPMSTPMRRALRFTADGDEMPPPVGRASDPGPSQSSGKINRAVLQKVTPPKVNQNPFLRVSDDEARARIDAGAQHRSVQDTVHASSVSEVLANGVPRYRAEFEEIKRIGRGSFGEVFLVQHRLDGCYYAVKRIQCALRAECGRKETLREVYGLAAINHPHVVRYFSSWTEEKELYIQMEYCRGGSVASMVERGYRFGENELRSLAGQVASGLLALHEQGLAHLDIKPENIWMTVPGTYKIGDLGLVTQADRQSASLSQEGDGRYIAPEILADDYSALQAADIFALGISLYELARGRPLPSGGEEFHAIRAGKLDALPGFSDWLVACIRAMLSSAPSDRPTAAQIVASPLGCSAGTLEEFRRVSSAHTALENEVRVLTTDREKLQDDLRRISDEHELLQKKLADAVAYARQVASENERLKVGGGARARKAPAAKHNSADIRSMLFHH